MIQNISGISIQVGLSGYSFNLDTTVSEWLAADKLFTTAEFQKRYESVDISLFTPKCTLVPKSFFQPEKASQLLSDVVELEQTDVVEYVELAEFGAVLVYSNTIGETLSKVISTMVLRVDGSSSKVLPELYYMLKGLSLLPEYNKICASYMDGWLYLVVAQGKTLQLCNVFKAEDFTTAQYFIFSVLKKLQLNPEVSTISFRTPLTEQQEISLYSYFKNVEQL